MEITRCRLTESRTVTKKLELVSIVPEQESDSNSVVLEPLPREPTAETLSIGGVTFDISRRLVACQNRHARLSQREFALLLVLARHKDRILSYFRIYRCVWGPTSKFSSSRLRLHVFRLRRRLNKGRINAIRIVNRDGIGYLMEIDRRVPPMRL